VWTKNTTPLHWALWQSLSLSNSLQDWLHYFPHLSCQIKYFFRFVWPCIINVGEERTNRWHKYRCSARVPTPHNRSQHIQANTTCGFIQSVLLTMGIMMPETCWVNLLWINIYTCVTCWFFLLLRNTSVLWYVIQEQPSPLCLKLWSQWLHINLFYH